MAELNGKIDPDGIDLRFLATKSFINIKKASMSSGQPVTPAKPDLNRFISTSFTRSLYAGNFVIKPFGLATSANRILKSSESWKTQIHWLISKQI